MLGLMGSLAGKETIPVGIWFSCGDALDYQTQIFDSLDQVESLREIWSSLQNSERFSAINADIDRFLSVMHGFGNSDPLVLLLRHRQEPRIIVIGRRQILTAPVKFAYKTILRPKLTCMAVEYGGVLGHIDEDMARVLVEELRKLLQQKIELDAIIFNHLQSSSHLYRQICTSQTICRNHFPVIHSHWRMILPCDMENFFQKLSRKHRANIKRTIRNFEDNHESEIRDERSNYLEGLARDAEQISIKTYQHSLNAGFSNNALLKSILKTDASLSRLRMSILYADTQPCAYQWGTVINNIYHLEKIGFDPDWTKDGVGNILFVKVLEQLCSDESIKYIDFGFGDAMYKKSYGDESWPEVAATYMFAPRIYPLLINFILSINSGFTLFVMWLARKGKVDDWIKRRWKKRLQSVKAKS